MVSKCLSDGIFFLSGLSTAIVSNVIQEHISKQNESLAQQYLCNLLISPFMSKLDHC